MMLLELKSQSTFDVAFRNSTGNEALTCPACKDDRKGTNKNKKPFSWDHTKGCGMCHNCEASFVIKREKPQQEKNYIRPVFNNSTSLSEKVVQWFQGRGISQKTLNQVKITEGSEWMPQTAKLENTIQFNYFRSGEIINTKFRDGAKNFKLVKDAELIFYNLEALDGQDSAVITEGEIDCLSMVEAKIYNCVSVPNGASKGSQKLEYLDNCWEYFKGLNKVILATDDDEPGRLLKDELARRIGKEKCWTIEYPKGCKDANEVLVKHGAETVRKIIDEAKQWPLEGIVSMDDIFPVITEWYEKGYPKGTKSGIKGFDHLLRFAAGEVTTITGIPGHGKDEFFNDIMANLAKNEGWGIGVCGFEESPHVTATKIAEKLTRKSFAFRKNPDDRMNAIAFEWAVSLIDKFFYFFNTEDSDTSIEGILKTAGTLVSRFGIKALYTNPWNWIEHSRPAWISETEYVSLVYSKIIMFARRYGVHVFIIAHTTKMVKDKRTGKYEVPTLYSISGSANFYNKTHNGVTVYRDFESGLVDVYVQKVKQSWLGKTGFSIFTYNDQTRQYVFQESSIPIEENGYSPAELGEGKWRSITDYSEPTDKDPF